jgi:hypothetical protein
MQSDLPNAADASEEDFKLEYPFSPKTFVHPGWLDSRRLRTKSLNCLQSDVNSRGSYIYHQDIFANLVHQTYV